MIRAEISGDTLAANGRGKHATDVNAGDRAAMQSEANKPPRELIHDDEHPITPKHDRLAAKEVHAPEAIGGVADERQPRRPGPARSRTIVFRQHTGDNVLVDVGSERARDDQRNPWTTEPRIA